MRERTKDKFCSGYEWQPEDFERWQSNKFAPIHAPERLKVNVRMYKKISRINASILLNIHLNRSQGTIEALRSLKKFILAELKYLADARYYNENKRRPIRHYKNNARRYNLQYAFPINARFGLKNSPGKSK